MSSDTLDKLEALARAATPGPWMTPYHKLSIHKCEEPCTAVAFTMTKSGSCTNHEANATYIAAFNPKTALALLAVARAASSMIREYDDLMLLLPGEHPAALRAALEELEGKK